MRVPSGELSGRVREATDARRAGTVRCDLHPRWSNSAARISFDSIHGKSRQIYIVELKPKN
ncbi:MAG: hypothetical protein AB1742_12490 [bacterium]